MRHGPGAEPQQRGCEDEKRCEESPSPDYSQTNQTHWETEAEKGFRRPQIKEPKTS